MISQIPLPNRQPSRAFFGAATDFIADVSNSVWFTPGIPITPQAPAEERPRRFDYPTGINISIIPRAEEQITFDQLRNLAELWDLLRLVIETRKDQIAGIPWVIRPRKEPDEKNVDYKARAKEDKRVQTATELFMRPDGEHLWQSWIRILLEEMFVLDALTIYPFKDRDGKVGLDILDGSTIKRLLDSQGRTPRPPDMAYEQIIKGMPAFGFRADQLFYRPRNQRAWKIYGYSAVEQIVITVNLAIRRQLYKLNYYCYSDDTEVLTKRGWQRFADVQQDDSFATRRLGTAEFEWQRATTFFRKPYVGEMVHVHNRSLDLLVTPNHRMLLEYIAGPGYRKRGQDHGRRNEKVVEAEALLGLASRNWGIPQTSVWRGRAVGPKTFAGTLRTNTKVVHMTGDQYCAFMGMWLAEGSVGARGRIAIWQSQKGKGRRPYAALLRSIFGNIAYEGPAGFEIHRMGLSAWLRQFGHAHEKFVPDDIKGATPAQLRIFWRYYYLGDGAARGARQAFTVSRRLADDLTEILQKIGLAVTVWTRAAAVGCIGARSVMQREGYMLTAGQRRATKYWRAERVTYRGHVACVGVPNTFLYVRRNGKAAWCGNTQGNMPEAIVQMPDTWPPDRIKQFQEWWNAMLAGDLDRRRQFFFVPGFGGKDAISYPKQDVIKDEMDEWLARVVCYTFSVSPQPFIKEGMSRFGVQQQQQMAKAEGLIPTLSWVSEVLSDVMENGLGWKGLEFVFQEDTEPDLLKRAQIQEIRVRNGLSQIDEVREENGDEEIGVGAGIITASGFIPFPGQEGAQEIPGPGGGYDDGYGGAGDTGVVFATGRRGDNTSEGGPPEPKGNGGGPKNGGPKNGNPPRPATKRLHGAGGRHAFVSPAQQARAARMEQLLSTFLSTQAAHAANRIVADYGRHAPARKFASEDVPLDTSELPVQIVLHGEDSVAYAAPGSALEKASRYSPAFKEFNQWMQTRGWQAGASGPGDASTATWTHPEHGTLTAYLDLPPAVRGPMQMHHDPGAGQSKDFVRAYNFDDMKQHVQAFEQGREPDRELFRPRYSAEEYTARAAQVAAAQPQVATGTPRSQSPGPGAYAFAGHGARTYEGDPRSWGGPHYNPDQPRDEHGQWVMQYGGALGKALMEELHLTVAAAVKAAVGELPRGEATIVPDITVNVAPATAAPVTVQPPAVNVTTPPMSIDAGAVQVTMPPVTIEKGAVQVSTPVSVAPAAVTVAAAPTPDVTVEASPAPPPAQVVIVNKQKRPKVKVKTSVQANLTPKATRKVVKRNALGEVESIDPVSDDEPPKR